MTFGSVALAQRILNFVNMQGGSNNGFRLLGSGLFREAHLHERSGIVYKVGSAWSNSAEVMNARETGFGKFMLDCGAYLNIPRTEECWVKRNSSVNTQEYAEGAEPRGCMLTYGGDCDCGLDPCISYVWESITKLTGLTDLHDDNVLYHPVTDEYWLVDLGG